MKGVTVARVVLGLALLLCGIVVLLSWGLGFSLGGLIGLLVGLGAVGGGIAVASGGNYRGGVPAVALAIVKGYKEIQLFGVHMVAPREIYMEVPNLMLWCGIAVGRGIRVGFLDGPLAQVYRYGFEPRGIPSWLPGTVANNIITDYNRTTRKWQKFYAMLTRLRYAYPGHYDNQVVTFEDAEKYDDVMEWIESLGTDPAI